MSDDYREKFFKKLAEQKEEQKQKRIQNMQNCKHRSIALSRGCRTERGLIQSRFCTECGLRNVKTIDAWEKDKSLSLEEEDE